MIEAVMLDSAGSRWHVHRAWPAGTATIAEVTAEQAGGDMRAAHCENHRLTVLDHGTDPRLPSLSKVLSGNESRLLVHRYGRRAVVGQPSGFTKILRPGKAAAPAERHRVAAQIFAPYVAIPQLLAADNDTLKLSGVPGRQLAELGRAGDADVGSAWAAVATVVAQLSTLPGLAALPEHSASDEGAIVAQWVQRTVETGLLSASTAARLPRVTHAVIEDLHTGDTGVRVPTHRDLHDGQLLWDGDQLGVIDFDTAALAEPALDIANLLAHLDLRARQWTARGEQQSRTDEFLAPDVAAGAAHTLLATLAPSAGLSRRIEVYRRAASLRLAGVYAWRPRWRALAIQWLDDIVDDDTGRRSAG